MRWQDRDYVIRRGIALLAFFLSGCAFSPSNSEIERALTRDDPLIDKVYQIRNIRRINGYERPEGYVVEFSAEISILANTSEYFGSLAKGDQTGAGAIAAFALAGGGLAKWGLLTAAAISAGKKGDVVPITGTITMIKSEQGWIARPD